jgi:PAS domain S-box-containing protein
MSLAEDLHASEARDNARLSLTGHERLMGEDDLIASKTDSRGVITYANRTFLNIADYGEEEVLNKPHNLVRHPHMPRCVFKLLWDTIKKGDEIFAYVINRARNGDHYWVFAHVTPTLSPTGEITGYHSNRRAPRRDAVNAIYPVYKELLRKENEIGGRAGMEASTRMLLETLAAKGVGYDEFVLTL